MQIHRENKLLFSVKFSDDELRKLDEYGNKKRTSVKNVLTGWIQGCQHYVNDFLQGSEVSDELERENG